MADRCRSDLMVQINALSLNGHYSIAADNHHSTVTPLNC
jgi:hypothetical protein